MKKYLILVLVSITVISFSSCEKSEEHPNGSKRIKQINGYSQTNELDYKVIFEYSNGKVVKITESEKNEDNPLTWDEEKREISYNGNKVTVVYYENEGGTWNISSKDEYIIEDNLVKESFFYDYEGGQYIKAMALSYQYSNSNLVLEFGSKFYSDGSELDPSKTEYVYENGKLLENKRYHKSNNNWIQAGKEVFTYNGNNLDNILSYEKYLDNWEIDHKFEYSYNNDIISSHTESYQWNEAQNDWYYRDTYFYTYDQNGNLIEKIYDSGYKEEYEYEDGNGNAKFVWYAFPTEYIIYKEPTFN